MESKLCSRAHGRGLTQPWRPQGPFWSPLPPSVHSSGRPAVPGTRRHLLGFALPYALSPGHFVCTFQTAPSSRQLSHPNWLGEVPSPSFVFRSS